MNIQLSDFESNLFNNNLPWLRDRTIILALHGSHCYGMATEDSDIDLKGVAVPPKEYFFGTMKRFEQSMCKEPDAQIYEVRKFINLASHANPNIFETLFCDPSMFFILTPQGEKLVENRHLFLSKLAKHRYCGYSFAQLKRLKSHRSFLMNPLKDPPTRKDFGLPERTLIPKHQLQAVQAAVRKKVDSWELDLTGVGAAEREAIVEGVESAMVEMGVSRDDRWLIAARAIGMGSDLVNVLERERQYDTAKRKWKQYQDWKKNRNPKRAALEAKYGADMKHASQLIRLLKMCREILTTGEVLVNRPDAEELLSIKNGAWSYEQIMEWAEREEKAMVELEKTSTLPKQPDREAIDKLCVEIVESML